MFDVSSPTAKKYKDVVREMMIEKDIVSIKINSVEKNWHTKCGDWILRIWKIVIRN